MKGHTKVVGKQTYRRFFGLGPRVHEVTEHIFSTSPFTGDRTYRGRVVRNVSKEEYNSTGEGKNTPVEWNTFDGYFRRG